MISDCCRFSKTICKSEWCELFPIRLIDFVVTPPCFYSKLDCFSIKTHTDTGYTFYDTTDVKSIFDYINDNMTRTSLEDTLQLIKTKNEICS